MHVCMLFRRDTTAAMRPKHTCLSMLASRHACYVLAHVAAALFAGLPRRMSFLTTLGVSPPLRITRGETHARSCMSVHVAAHLSYLLSAVQYVRRKARGLSGAQISR